MFKDHGKNHKEVTLPHGKLHVFANDEVFSSLENKVYEMADHNLSIPRNRYMSYTPDAHVGIGTCIGTTAVWNMGDGFVSPSIVGSDIGCGMRVHLTPLCKGDIQDKTLRREMIQAVEKYVPANERASSHYKNIRVEKIVKDGIHGLPPQYVPDMYTPKNRRSITHVEHAKFEYNHDFLEYIPEKMWAQAWKQIGTLGGGNHFIEIQYVKINEDKREIAEKWGLFDGQVVVMIHSGSRAWGGMLGPRYTKDFRKAMDTWGVGTPDPNLVYAPINSEVGQRYIHLMYSALNYAVVNRHMLAFGVRAGLKDVFGSDFEMPVLYDLMHNYALKEFHRNQPMLVHRKGTTRALPAGHFLNAGPYKETGHPALIPGSMGTSSYIMVGEQEGEKNFYSICHGAGRVRSRRATKELVSVDEFAQSMKIGTDDEVLVNQRTLESILDECPQAYKDVDQIIDSVVGAGLASVVAECKPMAVIKGL
ncbi:RtcB family protein [Paenactinomyces guangxiensis]|uniref:tRNA-splicing ligase RtcB n=1 Tax=Paenactinomyces guangxiensis TaxID=1490290 RepID=A0A7W1WRU0_9BACL|nr:RtcB family protein [Paenactinomyces guangxiensis]MBA4494905.1 RtcB family protein [Paenactinomyces guangxiensis]MBH8591988.1 RtcB family protein [Paenactinomyces guangxiensis]